MTNNAIALELLARVQKTSPLVHHITNHVVMNFTANATLAIGAQPVMAHAHEELEEMTGFASALVLNIGTLEQSWIESMLLAGKAASKRNTPIVLDPVGAGATTLRTDTSRRLLEELSVTVVRGNAGEVMAVAGEAGHVRGVDSLAEARTAFQVADALARSRKLVVAVTGPVDYVTDGTQGFEIANGHAMMGRVTGTGCVATTIVACFCGVAQPGEMALATAAALAVYGRAGELAAERSSGPGSFVPALLDALFHAHQSMREADLKITARD